MAIFESPIGPLLARASAGALVQLSFARRPSPTMAQSPSAGDDAEILWRTRAQLDEYFARKRKSFDIPLDLRGPAFHRQVWEALCQIPYGDTMGYGALATRLGDPGLARAVGAANGANPIAIIVPCHRVIGADGSLVGYGGGLRRKQLLLDLESDAIRLVL